jgi:hypothetical protein
MLLAVSASTAAFSLEVQAVNKTPIQRAMQLMDSYAERTGLSSTQPVKRYLWTDAFAVCNYLGLARMTSDQAYTDLALKLVEQVHHNLGKHRDDDARSGWISGLNDADGDRHPTRGGLRIGKNLPERTLNDDFDENLEWDRDGQYFHYLGKWMHALDQVTRFTVQSRYSIWARELAATAYAAFSYPAGNDEPRRMVWKMSIDLSHALVSSMGKHDPLEGYISGLQLAATAAALPDPVIGPRLDAAVAGYAAMVEGGEWLTDDPLGLGGLMVDAYRVHQLQLQGVDFQPELLETLLEAAIEGLHYYKNSGELQQPQQYRLAFRELGLTIGLHAVERMQQSIDNDKRHVAVTPRLHAQLGELMKNTHLREHIENFWIHPVHQQSGNWSEHRDINEVMLATSLIPDGFLELQVMTSVSKPAEALDH